MTRCARMIALAGLCLLLLACGPDGRDDPARALPGSWTATAATGPVTLVLQEDGKGIWRTELDEAAFKWSVQGSRLVLHTRSGGAVAAPLPENDTLRLSLPGVGELVFIRSEKK